MFFTCTPLFNTRPNIASAIVETTEDRVPTVGSTPNTSRFYGIIVDKLTVFPNPTANNINVALSQYQGEHVTITLMDMFGRMVKSS
ncbi:MAG: T9SS type A sorting domain-containing protein [Saprospiraceae bacterium]